jgi:hypothetical protein
VAGIGQNDAPGQVIDSYSYEQVTFAPTDGPITHHSLSSSRRRWSAISAHYTNRGICFTDALKTRRATYTNTSLTLYLQPEIPGEGAWYARWLEPSEERSDLHQSSCSPA